MLKTLNKLYYGMRAEKKACEFLLKKGLLLLKKNYRCIYGEIDLIMQEHQTLVFVEVRLRNCLDYGSALESIDSIKQQKIIKSATHYLHKHHLLDEIDCRFDVIGFSSNGFDWIKDAFFYE